MAFKSCNWSLESFWRCKIQWPVTLTINYITHCRYKEPGNQECKKDMEIQSKKDNFNINFHFNFWRLLVKTYILSSTTSLKRMLLSTPLTFLVNRLLRLIPQASSCNLPLNANSINIQPRNPDDIQSFQNDV